MQITVIATGSWGDVQPYIALAVGLQKAGHTVHLVSTTDFKELARSHDLRFFDVGENIESVAQDMQGLLERGNFRKILSAMGPIAERLGSRVAAIGLLASDGSDLILAGLGGLFVGLAVAEARNIPFIPAFLYPFTPTSEFPSVLAPTLPVSLPAALNRWTHRLTQQMMWRTYRKADDKSRREVLSIKPAPRRGSLKFLGNDGRDVLYGYSRHVIPIPGDWSEFTHVTGYWFLEPASRWEPPAELVNFINSKAPPIYIGFGSMSNRNPDEVAQLVFQALDRTGQRAVVFSGWGGLSGEDLPRNVYMVDSIPHSWLFPRMAAVVHHGGVGTTAAGLRAGVPSIVTPFFGDQPFWGRRVHELGVGPAPISRRRLSVDRLAKAISIAVTDGTMTQRAAQLGKKIRNEDGVGQAIAIIERTMGAHSTQDFP